MKITKKAVAEFKKMVAEAGGKTCAVRVFSSRGCCGSTYGMELTEAGEKGDSLMEEDGLKVYVSAEAAEGLAAATIDHDGKSFTIKGLPKAPSSCCG